MQEAVDAPQARQPRRSGTGCAGWTEVLWVQCVRLPEPRTRRCKSTTAKNSAASGKTTPAPMSERAGASRIQQDAILTRLEAMLHSTLTIRVRSIGRGQGVRTIPVPSERSFLCIHIAGMNWQPVIVHNNASNWTGLGRASEDPVRAGQA